MGGGYGGGTLGLAASRFALYIATAISAFTLVARPVLFVFSEIGVRLNALASGALQFSIGHKSPQVVFTLVGDQIRQFKILNSIIHLVVILVMHLFIVAKWTAQMLFHNVSVGENSAAIGECDTPIPARSDAALSCQSSDSFLRVAILSPSLPMFATKSESIGGASAFFNSAKATNSNFVESAVSLPAQIVSIAQGLLRVCTEMWATINYAFHNRIIAIVIGEV